MTRKFYAYDAAPGLIKRALGQAAVTTTGYVGTQWDQRGPAATDFVCVIDVEAIDVSSANEVYTFRVVGANQANRSDAQVLDMIQLGHAATITVETVNTAAGMRFVLRCRSELNNTQFRFLDLHLTVAGTTPSITFGAFFSKEF